jgi:hypothetical protein
MVNDSYGNAIMLMSHISQGIKSTLHRREQLTNTETKYEIRYLMLDMSRVLFNT